MNIFKYLKQKFCNHDCKWEKLKLIRYYEPTLYEATGEFYKRDGYKCSKCGKVFS